MECFIYCNKNLKNYSTNQNLKKYGLIKYQQMTNNLIHFYRNLWYFLANRSCQKFQDLNFADQKYYNAIDFILIVILVENEKHYNL